MPRASRLLFFPALGAALLAALLFWRWLGTPVALAAEVSGGLQCLSYTPFEPGRLGATSPGWVSTERIEDDLRRLAPYTRCLRLYTPLGTTPRVVQAASRQGFQVMLGAWIGSNLEQNDKEIRAALDLARRNPSTVTTLVVGNEVLLRRELRPAELAALIREVREESPVTVAYADVAHFIAVNPDVAAAADLLMIHLLPYWEDPAPPPVSAAVTQVLTSYDEFRERHPGKDVMIGETGWPSQGRMRGPGRPDRVSQARFVRELATRAAERGIRYNLIEAIDQPWKKPPEGTVGGFWGILDEQRVAKFPLAGPVAPQPHWRERFAVTAAAILATLVVALLMRPTPARWLAWSALSLGTGLTLVFQWDYAVATAQSVGDWLAAAGAVALTIAALWLLAVRLRPGQDDNGVPSASLAELGRALQAPRAPRTILGSPALLAAAFVVLLMVPAAWVALTLAVDPRHRDLPLARFLLPALALALSLGKASAGESRREEAVLAGVLLVCGCAQLESTNPYTWAWLGIALLAGWPWRRALGAELARLVRGERRAGEAQ